MSATILVKHETVVRDPEPLPGWARPADSDEVKTLKLAERVRNARLRLLGMGEDHVSYRRFKSEFDAAQRALLNHVLYG